MAFDYIIVHNIPNSYHSRDLRNFFSIYIESESFDCFHFRRRPEGQGVLKSVIALDVDPPKQSTNVWLYFLVVFASCLQKLFVKTYITGLCSGMLRCVGLVWS